MKSLEQVADEVERQFGMGGLAHSIYSDFAGTVAKHYIKSLVETRDFYELCQQYRHCKVDAAPEFEAIKTYLLTGALPWPSYDE